MKQLKYILLFSIIFAGINATETKQEPANDNGFEEFVEKSSAQDIKIISMLIDVTQNEASPEIWEQIFNNFVECCRSMQNMESQDPKALEKCLEFFSLIYNNLDKLHGNILMSASSNLDDGIYGDYGYEETPDSLNTDSLNSDSLETKKE